MTYIKWLKDFRKAAQKVVGSARKNMEKRVMRKAVRPVLAAAKALAPVDSSALRSSLSAKTDAFPKTASAYAVVGARKGYQKAVKKRKTAFVGLGPGQKQGGTKERKKRDTLPLRKPFKYIHLAERGRQGVKGSRFLRRAWRQSRQQFHRIARDEGFRELTRALR